LILFMGSSNQVAVVVPCLNEGKAIFSLVEEVRPLLPHVLVVNDGSTDATAREAARAGAKVLSHPKSQGKGTALQTGFAAALGQGFDWALAMDGDGQHVPSDIPHFLARLGSNPANAPAMVVGNRMQDPASMPFVRRVVNRWMSRRLGAYCGTNLPDSQCGFRLVNLHAWKRFHFSARSFEIESELIVRFLKAGLPVEFMPVQTRYGSESSKIRPLRDTVRWFRWWKMIRLELSENASLTRDRHFAPTPQDAAA
jgi:glycosyltransferase involved in cell wall biosynthesis